MTGELFYRYYDQLVSAGVDEFDNPLGPAHVAVYLQKLPVLRRTPKGAWIDLGFGDKRFVLLSAHKRFACPTIEEAAESFRARKAKQIRLLKARIATAQDALRCLDTIERYQK